jgi:hypothetical protein
MYDKIVKLTDEWTKKTLQLQVLDTESKYYGGVIDEASGVARANHGGTPAIMSSWAASLVNPDSAYYRDMTLLNRLELAADFMLNRQHPDGTISLGSTNYNSPPDTGFVVGGVTLIYRLLQRQEWDALQPAIEKIKLFLERTIPAMLTGGCHTPNHRWVLVAALAKLHDIFPLPGLIRRADEWLAEGMDMTADGEWTERSNGIYNAVSDLTLFYAAESLNRPELLDYVRRNLRMMLYMVHPSGEVVTEYSGRQDFGQLSDMSNYFLIYRLMAAHDLDPEFAAMSDYAGQFLKDAGGGHNSPIMGYLLYPGMHLEDVERAPLPEKYAKLFNGQHPIKEDLARIPEVGHHMKILHSSMHLSFGAAVARHRDRETSVTMMARAPSFFSLRHGKARLLGVKLATSFSPGIVHFDELRQENGGYRLSALMDKGYNGPIPRRYLPDLPQNDGQSPWYLLPHQHRPMTHLQHFKVEAFIEQGDGEWSIRVKSDEREDVFTQLTFVLGAEGGLAGSGIVPIGQKRYMLKEGSFLYTAGDDSIEIGSGVYDHWLTELREDPHPAGCRYVHVNLLTPFDRTFTVRLLPSGQGGGLQ